MPRTTAVFTLLQEGSWGRCVDRVWFPGRTPCKHLQRLWHKIPIQTATQVRNPGTNGKRAAKPLSDAGYNGKRAGVTPVGVLRRGRKKQDCRESCARAPTASTVRPTISISTPGYTRARAIKGG
eukprot:3796910-Rhodomonas_salina.2